MDSKLSTVPPGLWARTFDNLATTVRTLLELADLPRKHADAVEYLVARFEAEFSRIVQAVHDDRAPSALTSDVTRPADASPRLRDHRVELLCEVVEANLSLVDEWKRPSEASPASPILRNALADLEVLLARLDLNNDRPDCFHDLADDLHRLLQTQSLALYAWAQEQQAPSAGGDSVDFN